MTCIPRISANARHRPNISKAVASVVEVNGPTSGESSRHADHGRRLAFRLGVVGAFVCWLRPCESWRHRARRRRLRAARPASPRHSRSLTRRRSPSHRPDGSGRTGSTSAKEPHECARPPEHRPASMLDPGNTTANSSPPMRPNTSFGRSAAVVMFSLKPPRHITTLLRATNSRRSLYVGFSQSDRQPRTCRRASKSIHTLPNDTNELGAEFLVEPPDHFVFALLGDVVTGRGPARTHRAPRTRQHRSRTPPSEMSMTTHSRGSAPSPRWILAAR